MCCQTQRKVPNSRERQSLNFLFNRTVVTTSVMFTATLQKLFPLVLVIQVMVTNFAQETKANVLKECVNYTNCIETYTDAYSALASPKNYFNIALALYPARKPSSVLVHVNLHRFNQTGKSAPVPYTWSMSCLYAALPARVLELLSLGSILVTSRKRELDITIAPFCCNVSEEDRKKNDRQGAG